MILARVIAASAEGDLELAFARMELPPKVRQYLHAKIPSLHVLLTGLGLDDAKALKAIARSSEAPGKEEYPFWAPGDDRRPGTSFLSGRRDQFDNLLDELEAGGRSSRRSGGR